MGNDPPKRETMPIEEATVSNMWEISAIVELSERKSPCTKQDLLDIIAELRKKTPLAKIPELEQVGRIVEMGARMTRGTTH